MCGIGKIVDGLIIFRQLNPPFIILVTQADGRNHMGNRFATAFDHTQHHRQLMTGICIIGIEFDRSLGSFEATRYARGHKALYTLEINGEHASIFWDLHDLHRLQYFDHRDEGRTRGWRSVHITDGDHPYMNKWWVPGLQIGYEHTFIHQAADFIEGIETEKPAAPTFRDALATDLVTDAVLKSAKTGQWENAKA